MADYTIRKIKFHPNAIVMLDELQAKLGLADHCQVIQKSIQLMAAVIDRTVYIDKGEHAIQQLIIVGRDDHG